MIEDFSKYKFFYANGSSFTEGGGLEEPEIRGDSFKPLYEKYYDVTWKNRTEVNWANRLSQIINVKSINEAKSGGGMTRSIRMTYDFIQKNWKNKDKFFIILETPDSSRCDVYHKKTDEYFIVNTNPKTEKLAYACRDYYNLKSLKEDENLQDLFNNWVDNHYDLKNEIIQSEKALIGLYSFCKINKIKIFLMNDISTIFSNVIDKKDIIFFENRNYDDINSFCNRNKLTIIDEMNQFNIKVTDGHPGFFGHIEYAKKLSNYLGWKGNIPDFLNISKSEKPKKFLI